jgi:acyl carrier protein
MPGNDQTTTMHATELRALIADVLELPIDEITDASRFIDDLEVDSLASLQIAVQVEKRFGVSIAETHLASIGAVADMRKLVESRMAEKSGG